MDQPMGGKIALRQLGPLPDLNSVVFVRKQNRAFVTGQGPLATSASKMVRRFLRAGTWVFLIAGVVITLVVGAMEYFERAQRTALEGGRSGPSMPRSSVARTGLTSVPFQLHGRGQGLSPLRAPDPRRHVRQAHLAGDLCRRQSRRLGRGAGQPAAALRGQYRRASGSSSAPACSCWRPSIGSSPGSRSGAPVKEARLAKDGGLLGAELVQAKYYAGGPMAAPEHHGSDSR